jgi:hypothetical protein
LAAEQAQDLARVLEQAQALALVQALVAVLVALLPPVWPYMPPQGACWPLWTLRPSYTPSGMLCS